MLKLLDLFRKGRASPAVSPAKVLFLKKYQHFQNLLAGNNRALELITDLEQVCYGSKPFSPDYVMGQVKGLQEQVGEIARDLNALSGGKYPRLLDAVDRISENIFAELGWKKTIEKTALIIPLRQLSLERLSEVGGKAASLGEVFNRVNLPVPYGFAVTAYACHNFMESGRLYEKSEEILKGLDIDDTAKLVEFSREIQETVLHSPLPPELEQALLAEMDTLLRKMGPEVRIAVRSSATSEDSESSFAGQHSSVLGVSRDRLLHAYKTVVASMFNPRAIYYRRSRGYPDEYVVMSVLCVVMVQARASGVMYTRDPNDPSRNVVLVNAVWGLGLNAVDGSVPTDFYEVDKTERQIVAARPAEKLFGAVIGEHGELAEEAVPEALRLEPCLDNQQLMTLFDYGLTLEQHYRSPLDIEWALDRNGRIIILQCRPLNIHLVSGQEEDRESQDPASLRERFPQNPVLLQGGSTASRGKASGLAYILSSDHNMMGVPEGSILIAKQTSPRYVPLLGRVQAIVTDVGSVTGHMASVAREFGVPALVETGDATSAIPHGEEITVDATHCVVFQGRVESILERKRQVNPMKGSPTYKAAHAALKNIAVLNLLDPESPDFSPEGCRTFHDVIRFAHEKSMRTMFRISDDIELSKRSAVQLKAPLPMKILAVDLGGGLSIPPDAAEARIEDVVSIPFQSLLRGMTHPGVQWFGAVDVNLRGFASIVSESMFRDTMLEDRMGGPSYVVVSSEYVNFNSRLGYHFAVVDSYCGSQVNDNYVTFSFKGGAADIGRRSRRAMLIAKILKAIGLKVQLKGDMVQGEIKKYDCAVLQEKLDLIGRLMGAMRLLDMALSDDGRIDWYAEEFMKGNYTFNRG